MKGAPSEEITPEQLDLSPEAKKVMERLQKKYGAVTKEEADNAYETIQRFIQGKMTWGQLFNFTPKEMHDIAEIGYGYFKDTHYDKAEQIFKGLAVLDPDHYYYRQMLGAVFQKRNQLEDAEAHYNDALVRNKDDIVSYTNRGEVYLRMGQLDKAVADFDEAIGRDKDAKNKWAARARQLKYRIEHKDELIAKVGRKKGKE